MARIRSVHPGLFTDENFVQCSSISQVFLIGIWTECDDHGIFEWKPITLKMKLMAAHSYDALAHLEELVQYTMVSKVEFEGKAYGLVRNFCIWQRPKKPTFRYPLQDAWRTYVGLKPDGTRFEPQEAPPAPLPVTHPEPIKGGIAPQRERREGGSSSGREEESNQIDKTVVVVLAPEPASSKHDDNDEGDQSDLEGTQEPRALAAIAVPGMPIALPEDWTPNGHDEDVAKSFGMTPEVIEQQLLEFHAYNAHRGTLSPNWSATWYRFCSAWKAKNTPVERKVPPRVETSAKPTSDQWHKQVEMWKGNNSLWSHKTFGPEPGMGGCRCPNVILTAHGIDPKTGIPLREPVKTTQPA